MQTPQDKEEEIKYNKGQTYDDQAEYRERCYRTYPLLSYYSHLRPYLKTGSAGMEMGCGNGFFTFYLENIIKTRLFSIDISKEFTENAQIYGDKHGYKSRFFQMDAEKTQFKSNSFDFIVMLDVLHHFPQTEDILKEIHRLLTEGGLFFFFEPNPWNPYVVYSVLKGKILNGSYGYDHERHFTRTHYEIALKESGFKIVESKTIRYIPRTVMASNENVFKIDCLLSAVPVINRFGFSSFMVAQKV